MAETDNKELQEEIKASYRRFCDLIASTFPPCKSTEERGPPNLNFYRHKDHGWCASLRYMAGAMLAQEYLVARPTDVFIATTPKSGTTWTKALVHTLVNRHQTIPNPLPPHQQIRSLEMQVYTEEGAVLQDVPPGLGSVDQESPRMFSTHIPYPSLPKSIVDNGCRIVYMWRDPKDSIVSLWHMVNGFNAKNSIELVTLDKAFEWFCDGVSWFGPFWDHVLGYWNASTKKNANILFLKYEDVMADPVHHLKKLGEFLGKPFTDREEKEGVIEDIVHRCSFETMKNSKVSGTGVTNFAGVAVENGLFFRKGRVGDHQNYFTPTMVEKMDRITQDKFSGSGIAF